MNNASNINSNLAIPPGEFLEEVISDFGITKDELARRMNRPAAKLSAIYKGDKAITPETALQLEKVVGVPAHVWIGLENEYRLTLARQKELQMNLQEEAKLITSYCYRDLAKLNYVKKCSKSAEKVIELQKFFGVTSLNTIANLNRYQPFFRISNQGLSKHSPEVLAAWLRMGEIEAHKTDTEEFNKKRFIRVLQQIRALTRLEPEEFIPKLETLLAESGIAFVVVPHLPKTYAHGATYWLGKSKAILMLTLRKSWADIFWFSLFHEIGHILLHSNQIVFVEGENHNDTQKKYEFEADKFAANTLIPPKQYNEFIKKSEFYKNNILRFAERVKIDPGIVVGRLQYENYIKNSWHNQLRSRYIWKASYYTR